MCGIVGAVAQRDVANILLEGLKRLEYRGYDSAGIAVRQNNGIVRERVEGKVNKLVAALDANPLPGTLGIAHTRWATHGVPSVKNAHPHFSDEHIALVHNGIIENHDTLRDRLIEQGYQFHSDTDTEVIVHLLHWHQQHCQNFLETMQKTIAELEGAYGIGAISMSDPDTLYAVRSGSPLVIGVGIGEHFIASDPLALLPVTNQFVYLEEGDLAVLSCDTLTIFDRNNTPVTREAHTSHLTVDNTSKGEFRHFMLKEIYEQPQVAIDALDGRYNNHDLLTEAFGLNAPQLFAQTERVHIIACGTSYHAGLAAKYWLERYANIACEVEVASEKRYRYSVVPPNTLLVALSQSGETADTLAALRQAKTQGYMASLAICNVPASSLVREADLSFMIRAGTEIGVAATKSFTAQLMALLMFTQALAQHHSAEGKPCAQALAQLPQALHTALGLNVIIEHISTNFKEAKSALFLGRDILYPIALEGALKLKEISYIHAEAYPAGELKHGPLALVDEDIPIIILAPNDHLSAKLQSNIQEVQARGGKLFIFADERLRFENNETTTIISMPPVPEIIAPIFYNIPLQLLAYHVAVIKGTDVDQPRNLAKSVTVE